MCTEQILIKTGGELSQHLARVVTPLLIHDLPVVLWWPDDPPFGTRQFTEVVGHGGSAARRLGQFHEDGGKRLAGLATVVADGVSVTDIGWLRLHAVARAAGRHVRPPAAGPRAGPHPSVRIDIARPTSTLRVSKAAFYLWLARRAPGLGGGSSR